MPTPVIMYCPRCDKQFEGLSRVLTWREVLKHVRRAHPEFIPMVED